MVNNMNSFYNMLTVIVMMLVLLFFMEGFIRILDKINKEDKINNEQYEGSLDL